MVVGRYLIRKDFVGYYVESKNYTLESPHISFPFLIKFAMEL